MSKRTSIKSFEDLHQSLLDRERKKQIYLRKKKSLISEILMGIAKLETSKNGITRKDFRCKVDSKYITTLFNRQEKIKVESFIKAAEKYINLTTPDLDELVNIKNVINGLIKKSSEIDKRNEEIIRREKEQKRREKERAEHLKKITEQEIKKLNEFCEKQIARRPLRNILEQRNIKYLYHFTRVENLDSILRFGIQPRKELDKSHIKYICNDEVRWEDMLGCSCLSIEYPNTWLLKSMMENAPDSKWAIITLNAELLHNQINYYAEHNAATASVKENLRGKHTHRDFENLFSDDIKIRKSNGKEINYLRDKTLKPYLPTSDQAEILVHGTIDPEYICKIIFQDMQSERDCVCNMSIRNIATGTNAELFKSRRSDYIWEDR